MDVEPNAVYTAYAQDDIGDHQGDGLYSVVITASAFNGKFISNGYARFTEVGGGVNPPRRAQASVDEERINNVLGGLVTRVGGPPQRTADMMVTHMFAPTLVEAAERGLLKDDRATPVAPVASAARLAPSSSRVG